MQEFFFESPMLLAFVGSVLSGGTAYLWLHSGHRTALLGAAGLGVLTIFLVLLNIQVQTDTERIREILDEVASALRKNDRERVYSYIHPNAVEGVSRAKSELPRYKFHEARITRIKLIDVNTQSTPPTARAEFNVFVKVEVHDQTFKVPRFIKVYFMKLNERWLVRDYEHHEPTMGFRDIE